MQHIQKQALLASAVLIRKGDEDDTTGVVTKALEDLQASVDARLKEVETKTDTSKLETRLKDLETKANRPGGEKEQKNEEAAAEKKAFGTYLRHGNQAPADELKTLTVSSDPGGGYLAPKEVSSEFIRDLTLVSPVRSVASVRSTAAPSVTYPKRLTLTNAKWKGETQAAEQSEPSFGQAEIVVKEMTTWVPVSNQLLADSGGDAEAEVRLALADDFGQKEGRAFVNGNGVLEPEGLLVNADIGFIPNTNTGTLVADALVALMYSLPTQYRNAATWAMNSTTLGKLRLLKDGDGRFLWQPAFQLGQPETILGKGVVELPDMPDIANNAFPILFGDFSGYRIVDRAAMTILVNPYTQAVNGITQFHATRRVGGAVLQPAKFKKLKMSAA